MSLNSTAGSSPGGWFIQEHQPGTAQQFGPNTDSLALSSGEISYWRASGSSSARTRRVCQTSLRVSAAGVP